jgi:fatty acid desaturase
MTDARRKLLEWPTLAVAGAVYAGYGLLTFYYHSLPWWLLLPAGGYLVALHGSLQHEVVHGHPTPWLWVNRALVFPSLWLWMPLEIYADTHLRHHRDPMLTDPLEDPESYYLTGESWARAGRLRRAVLVFHNTALGRLVMGPLVSACRLLAVELTSLRHGDFRHGPAWLVHLPACAMVLYWVIAVCGIPLAEYALLFVYPGISLTLLRSFAEHRARPELRQRVAVVESGALMSLLYLNNNLHLAHHREPHLAWYALPGRWREQRAALLGSGVGYRYAGYGEILRRYLVVPREPVAWPLDSK